MLIDGSREGTRHSQKTMDHFNAVVFKGTVAAETRDEDADSSEMDVGLDDLSIRDDDDLPLGRMQDPPTLTRTDPEHSDDIHSQFDGTTGSLHVATPSPSHTTQFQPLSDAGDPTMISQASTHSHSSSNQHAHSVHMPDSRRHLTPTASISMPPPPIIDTELQYNSDDDVPLPKQSVVGPSPEEDVEVTAQPATKGKRKARAKAAKPRQAEPFESGPDTHDAPPIDTRRSARAGQKSKSRVP